LWKEHGGTLNLPANYRTMLSVIIVKLPNFRVNKYEGLCR
jgi:hypothetical protein